MSKCTNLVCAALLLSFCAVAAAEWPASAPHAATTQWAIPNFTPNRNTSWLLNSFVDDLLYPPAGPGPIMFDSAYPHFPNYRGGRPTYRIADLSNPILQPWTREHLRNANAELLAGKIPFRARERCWPIGVPGFVTYSLVEPFHFIQTPKEVTIINSAGPQVRQIYLNVPHSSNPKLSWYGESVGHYEGGDTLVIDTIAIGTKAFVDNYLTPHTGKLHERLKLIEDGTGLQILVAVDDLGAFTTPWSGVQRWRKLDRSPMREFPCKEDVADRFAQFQFLAPVTDNPDS